MKKFFEQLYITTRAIIIILPIIILVWLIKLDLVTTGQLEFVYDFSKISPVITELFPANRLSEVFFTKSGAAWQQINREPVYFEVRVPQKFEVAQVEVAFKNPLQNLFQIGLRTLGEGDFNYYFKPLDNKLLNSLDWFRLDGENATLWQRTKKFLSLDQFFEQAESLTDLASYRYDLKRKFILLNYQPETTVKNFNKTLRGNHSFYTYAKNEPLNFTFTIQDINRSEGLDPIVVKAYAMSGELADIIKMPDDGIISNLGPTSAKKEIRLLKNNLPEGAYRIEFEADDDIVIRQISTTNRYLTFINRLYLIDNFEYLGEFNDLAISPTTIFSTIPRLGFETSHDKGLQTIGLGAKQSLEIKNTHQNYYITPEELPTYIVSPANDLKIFGQGLMALSQDAYFNPDIYNLADVAITKDIDYLLSSYALPKIINGWQINKGTFDLTNAKIDNRKLRFALSAPELNDFQDSIALKYIKIKLTKQPLTPEEAWQKIIKYIKDRL